MFILSTVLDMPFITEDYEYVMQYNGAAAVQIPPFTCLCPHLNSESFWYY